ncbi:hypothetical protein GGX14DRAFT_628092 [Mycena pura]|uniref:Uncharacterized protein n=1 Tax=Mycena pura TaxID=153505 RepID=A0AAD6YRB3_9AGAR|nr:hypothetical protein GGX14DRAFT_628092 [Mycena pura]
MSKAAVKTLYTARFYETPSSSDSTNHSSKPRPSATAYLDRLFETHVALSQMEEVPSSRPTTPDAAGRQRVEILKKQVRQAFEDANGNPASGKWGTLVNLLQTGTAKGKYRYIDTKNDAVPPQPGPDGWPPLAETEEEWFAWEKRRKEQLLLKEKVEHWKRDINASVHDDEPEQSTISPPAKLAILDGVKPSSVAKSISSASRLRARGIADLPEAAFLPPSFPNDLETSTPPAVIRYKPAPIELVPSSSPLSPLAKQRELVPGPSKDSSRGVPSSSPLSSPKNTRTYERLRPRESPRKRARSPSPMPITPAKKSHVEVPSSSRPGSGSAPPASTSSPIKREHKAPFTPPRNALPKLADLLAASAHKKKTKAKAKDKINLKGKEKQQRASGRPQDPMQQDAEPSSLTEEQGHDMEASIAKMAAHVINWDAAMDKAEAQLDMAAVPSPTKSLSSIDGSNSLESQGSMDMPDFSHDVPFDPQGASTQPMGRIEAGESLGTTERGVRGFGQPDEYGFPMRYESQMDVENNMQSVEKLLDADVGGYAGPWMGEDDEQWDLPVELLYLVQLHALSPALPEASRYLHSVFAASPPSFRAQYILRHVECEPGPARLTDAVSVALRFPLCTVPVLEALLRIWPSPEGEPITNPAPLDEQPTSPEVGASVSTSRYPVSTAARGPELPRRLFRTLSPRTDRPYADTDAPLPLLRLLYDHPRVRPPPAADAHAGYALARAVHAEHVPLVRFLLARGASPRHKRGLAVLIAIRRKKLALVRMLVERTCTDDAHAGRKRGAKRRKLEDRVIVTPEMLKAAVKAKARDIAEYFMQEKGCVPDMQTLHMLVR